MWDRADGNPPVILWSITGARICKLVRSSRVQVVYRVWILVVSKIPNEVPRCTKLIDAVHVIAFMLFPLGDLHSVLFVPVR